MKKLTYTEAITSNGGIAIGLISVGISFLISLILPQGLNFLTIPLTLIFFFGAIYSFRKTVNKQNSN